MSLVARYRTPQEFRLQTWILTQLPVLHLPTRPFPPPLDNSTIVLFFVSPTNGSVVSGTVGILINVSSTLPLDAFMLQIDSSTVTDQPGYAWTTAETQIL